MNIFVEWFSCECNEWTKLLLHNSWHFMNHISIMKLIINFTQTVKVNVHCLLFTIHHLLNWILPGAHKSEHPPPLTTVIARIRIVWTLMYTKNKIYFHLFHLHIEMIYVQVVQVMSLFNVCQWCMFVLELRLAYSTAIILEKRRKFRLNERHFLYPS